MSTPRASLAELGLTALRVNWDAVTVVTLFLVAFAVYARTAAPGVLDGDFGEFQTNIYLLGVSHTGYPLYFLLAKLWTLIMPVGDIAYRANVFSGFFGALTLVILYAALRTLNLSIIISLGISVLFGVSRVQWSQAVIPDVYTLNSFFIVLIIWLAILWRMGRVPLWSLALAYGFSLTHHRTMIWFAPPLAIYALWAGGRTIFQPRDLIKTIAALFLPLLLYLYIPLRGESFVGVEYHPANNINIFALNAVYDLRFGPTGFIWERITQVYLALLIEQFTPIGFIFGILGILALATNRVPKFFPTAPSPRQLLLLIGLAHLLETAFAIVFWVIDSEIFFIPSYLTFLFFIAIGFATSADMSLRGAGWATKQSLPSPVDTPSNVSPTTPSLVTRPKPFSGGPSFVLHLSSLVIALLFLALTAYLLTTNYPRNDQSNNDAAQARWQNILTQPLEPNATIMGPWEDLTPLEYYQFVENVRTDLKRQKIIIFKDQLKLGAQGDIADETRQELKNGSSVYLTRHPADTETLDGFNKFTLVPFASLWRTTPRGAQDRTRQKFASDDALQQLTSSPSNPAAGTFNTLQLDWASDAPLENTRLILALRDTAPNHNLWTESETLLLGGRTPEPAQATIRDQQGFFIPPDAPPGVYTLTLTAFARDSQTPIEIVGNSNQIKIELHVTAPPPAAHLPPIHIEHPLTATAGDKTFLGYDVSDPEPRGGDIVEFSSRWKNISNASDQLEIKLRDANDTETTLYQGLLFPNSDGAFNPAQTVRARQALTIPPQTATGYGSLLVSLNGQALPPIRIAFGESTRRFRVPIIQRPQLTLVGDSLQLLGYKLDRTQYRRGESIPLTLYWSANQTPPASYKVFTQLIDANGVLRAQQDSIPQNGRLPTNRWFPGEYITDDYSIPLPNDLAAGTYTLLVGMYDQATGTRIPLRDSNNTPLPNDATTFGDTIQIQP